MITTNETTYRAALRLVARIDAGLDRGVRHYRTKAGKLLTTLDEVINAILNNNLMEPEDDNYSLPCNPDATPHKRNGAHLVPVEPDRALRASGPAAPDDHPAPGRTHRRVRGRAGAAVLEGAVSADGSGRDDDLGE